MRTVRRGSADARFGAPGGLATLCTAIVMIACGCNGEQTDPDGSGGAAGAGGSGGKTGSGGEVDPGGESAAGGTRDTGGSSAGGDNGTGGGDATGGMGGGDGALWTKVELEGAVCADGSPYKFFFKRAKRSAGLTVTLEPGGACWDYESCGGSGGPSRAYNLQGIEDDHMVAMQPDGIPWGLMFPHLGVSDRDVATANYDHVYLPYCTGDAFVGDFTATYESPDDQDEIVIEHRGAANIERVAEWLSAEFASPKHLLVVGASAGGLGGSFHYARIRDAVSPERASFINDSGPIFPPGGPQDLARQAFVLLWRTQDLLAELDERLEAPAERRLTNDSGHLLSLLSDAFPEDRFLMTYFLSDLDNSRFSYGLTLEEPTVGDLVGLWLEDTEVLVDAIESTTNWGYYLPGFRADNCSHTVTLLPIDELTKPSYLQATLQGSADGYLRTNLEDLDFNDALDSVLARDGDLIRARASEPMTDFTEAEANYCLGQGG